MSIIQRFLTSFRDEAPDALSPGLIQKEDGSVWVVAPDGTETPVAGGGSQPIIVSQTFTAAEIAARYDGDGTAFVEFTGVGVGDVINANWEEEGSTLDQSVTSTDQPYAYLPDASTADVLNNGEAIGGGMAWEARTYSDLKAQSIEDLARLRPGAVLYNGFSASGPPTVGETTISMIVWKAT